MKWINDYQEYLQSPEWQVRRNAKIWLAKNKCQTCNIRSEQLHVHHNNYNNVGKEKPEDLIVLCVDCHGKIHDKKFNDSHGILKEISWKDAK